MRTRVVIQSRLSSSRLPGKALMTVGGMPLIELVARRAARGGFEVVVATSVEPYDDRIVAHLTRVGVPVVRGSLDDVLGRFVEATADLDPADRVVRLTGDNPVVDAALVEELVAAVDASGNTYGRVDIDQVPEGLGAEVFPVAALRAAGEQATDAYDREHVTPWLRRELGELLFAPAANPGDPVAYRCTADCLHDYDRISRLFDAEDDPVGAPWSRLVATLKAEVDARGPGVPAVDRQGSRLSQLLLGVRRVGLAGLDETRDGAAVRAVFAAAVDRGVSHVWAAPGLTPVVRQGTLPALQQRLGTVVRLPGLARTPHLRHVSCQVSASVERAFADVGQRRLAGAVFSSIDDAMAGDGAAWHRLQAYRRDGHVAEIGVAVSDPQEAAMLERLRGLDLVVVPFADGDRRFLRQAVSDRLADLAGRGVTVLGAAGACPPKVVAELSRVPWVDAVIAEPATTGELDALVGALGGRR